jgi:hypothetical protein
VGLSREDVAVIDAVLGAPDAEAAAFGALRRQLPHLAWTRCDASDVTETPFRSYRSFDIHLLDGAGHCVEITADPGRATGIVLAWRAAP